ncbi:LysR family transcriptional regulator [Amycolatopsis australiensis]|uniref:DNA-binding transcriptional regulator, LysR family n=1 Tax=Amycolatopsis australiensis TaxID=546364 RepID=A0A1K1RT60_9PSEU|nr:LysR family transcriptional regulator [Amycolatopsis australiensis]SFW75328.1 DNA-binding transcriptional regulator, LysR family [Amycolatopsis australiensis]
MIDIQRLRVLREVARHGSFSKAAAALRFTPSAVSQHIAALERSAGTDVVHRSTRGVRLTEAGRLLADTAETVLAELHTARARLSELAGGRRTLTVATFTTGGRRLLPAALAALTAAHPDVEPVVLEREPEDAIALVRAGEADLALAYRFDRALPLRPADRDRLAWTPLGPDPMSVVVHRDHPLADRKSADLTEIAGERWVLGCSKTADFLHRQAAEAGFELRVSGSSTDYYFAQAMVRARVGISLVPGLAIDPGPDLAVVPLNAPRPTRHVGIVTARTTRPEVGTLRAALTGSAARRALRR